MRYRKGLGSRIIIIKVEMLYLNVVQHFYYIISSVICAIHETACKKYNLVHYHYSGGRTNIVVVSLTFSNAKYTVKMIIKFN